MRQYLNYLIILILFLPHVGYSEKIIRPRNIPEKAEWDSENKYWRLIENTDLNIAEDKAWYATGEIAFTGNLKKENGLFIDGSYIYFYKNGNKSEKGRYKFEKKYGMKRDGEWIHWDVKGIQDKISIYDMGKLIRLHIIGDPERPPNVPLEAVWNKEQKKWRLKEDSGRLRGWYNNGQLAYEGFHDKKGKAQGIITTWHENGNKWVESFFIDGLRDGQSQYYHEDGIKYSEVLYSKGKKQIEKFFNKDQSLKEICKYGTNEQLATQELYKNGKLWGENRFKDGKKVEAFAYKSGNETWHYLIKDDEPYWVKKYKDGKLVNEGKYSASNKEKK